MAWGLLTRAASMRASLLLLLCCVFPAALHAQPVSDCPPEAGPLAAIADAIASAKRVFTEVAARSAVKVRFDLGGVEVGPGETILVEVPAELRGRIFNGATIGIGKDESRHGASIRRQPDGTIWDDQAAYTRIDVHVPGRGWVSYGQKFAEPRLYEFDELYRWPQTIGDAQVDAVRLVGIGRGEHAIAKLASVELEMVPEGRLGAPQEEVFTPGTSFASGPSGSPRFGGGPRSIDLATVHRDKGWYPGAAVIGGWGSGAARTLSPSSFVDANGRLHVTLPPGKKLAMAEVSAGDAFYAEGNDSQMVRGDLGGRGWAKLSMRLVRGGAATTILSNENVTPSSVLSAAAEWTTQEGDELVIEAAGHRAWVMGYRLSFLEGE